ncbi:hypothetical protein RA086_13585 [Lactiplantibacillus sp. WILCCON 0030]|uniref:Uncharacterized protein n=1 Tax=Lactiplantibacillus brownii TaxID=3069269 RepID=A0ABU1ACR9_9LACO|nr:hypothetical protein [Lactiplantibacillus brownii]MDQ7938641.1 hypothetical protein [Lactiplantibacillus brownii]
MSGNNDGLSQNNDKTPHHILNKTISREFSQQGLQILVFGSNDQVKTRFVHHYLDQLQKDCGTNHITMTLTSQTTLIGFLTEVTAKLESSFSIKFPSSELLPVTNYFIALAEILFTHNVVLVVTDMTVSTEQTKHLKQYLANLAKNMSDDAINYADSHAKIIFIGNTETAEELWSDVQSLKSRLATILAR